MNKCGQGFQSRSSAAALLTQLASPSKFVCTHLVIIYSQATNTYKYYRSKLWMVIRLASGQPGGKPQLVAVTLTCRPRPNLVLRPRWLLSGDCPSAWPTPRLLARLAPTPPPHPGSARWQCGRRWCLGVPLRPARLVPGTWCPVLGLTSQVHDVSAGRRSRDTRCSASLAGVCRSSIPAVSRSAVQTPDIAAAACTAACRARRMAA